jgi:hypothetical protein
VRRQGPGHPIGPRSETKRCGSLGVGSGVKREIGDLNCFFFGGGIKERLLVVGMMYEGRDSGEAGDAMWALADSGFVV